jgi:hypothetical protein
MRVILPLISWHGNKQFLETVIQYFPFITIVIDAALFASADDQAPAVVPTISSSLNSLNLEPTTTASTSFPEPPTSQDPPTNNGFSGFESFDAAPVSNTSSQSVTSAPNTLFDQAEPQSLFGAPVEPQTMFSAPLSNGTPSFLPEEISSLPAPEPDCIRMWRAEFESTIQDRDSASNAKHGETLKTAQGQLERFYAEYNDKKEKSAKKLKDAEVKTAATPKSENFWV